MDTATSADDAYTPPERENLYPGKAIVIRPMRDQTRKDLFGRVLELKDLIAYQEGTVASRMLVNRKTGSITIFSFDKDEGLSEHTAPFDAVVTILDGECEVWVAGETFAMREGQSIVFPANVPHALSAVSRFKMSLTMIKD